MFKIYQISLPQQSGIVKNSLNVTSEEKKEHVKNVESLTNVPTNIVVDTNYHKEKYGFPMSVNEIVNFLTHKEIWKYFLESSLDHCMIIEDNVSLKISLQTIEKTLNILPCDWDIFFPYGIQMSQEQMEKKEQDLLNHNIREDYLIEPFLLGFKWGNSIYFLSRKGAKKLLNIDTIKQRLDDEMIDLSLYKNLKAYVDDPPWFDYKSIQNFDFSDRKSEIWNAINRTESWTEQRKIKVRKLLKIISTVSQTLSIDLILQGGTHLGYIRHGGIMPWDDDVDLGIEEKNIHHFLSGLESEEEVQFSLYIEPRTNVEYYKIWFKSGEPIQGYDYTFPFVDLWLFKFKNNDLKFKNGIICRNSAKKKFIPINFEGSLFKITYNSLEVLDSRYSSWREKILVYMWSHRLEHPGFQPLSVEILINPVTGRMIGLK